MVGLTDNSTPAMAAVSALYYLFTPKNFPHQWKPQQIRIGSFTQSFKESFDICGAFLLLSGSMLLIAVLLESGSAFGWNSAATIVMLILSVIILIIFLFVERKVTYSEKARQPIFPWRFLKTRVWMGVLL